MKVFYLTTNKINLRILKWFASLTWLALKMGWALGIWQQHSDAALVLCTVFAHKHSFVGNVGWHHILTMELDCFGNNVWAASGSRESEIREIKKQPGPAAAQITFARLISGSLIVGNSPVYPFSRYTRGMKNKSLRNVSVLLAVAKGRERSFTWGRHPFTVLVNFHVVFKLGP